MVVDDIFYLQHMTLYRKYVIKKGSTRKPSHRRDLISDDRMIGRDL